MQLEQEQMVILGQVVQDVGVDELKVGMPMDLVLEVLHPDEDGDKLIWKWKPGAAS